MSGPTIKVEAPVQYRRLTKILRIETDRLERCVPKIETVRKYIVFEEKWFIHFDEFGKLIARKLPTGANVVVPG